MKLNNIYKYLLILIVFFVFTFSVFVLIKLQRIFSYEDMKTPMSEFESEIYEEDLSNISVISSIEGNAEFKFPPSSRDIYAYTTGLRDIFIQVRFAIDTNDLQRFIDSTKCNSDLQEIVASFEQTENQFDWWELSKSTELKMCSGSSENFGQEVYVDMSNLSFYIIYILGGTH